MAEKVLDYLRISVTDRCNLRCIYCMPEDGIVNKPHSELLTFEEITRLVGIFSGLGIRRIRLTGGEPLVRKGIVGLIKESAYIKGIEEIALTTNGTLLSQYARELKDAGLSRINISLDTLDSGKFRTITRHWALEDVLAGIREAKKAGFPIKLNVVVMKGVNDDEILDFVNFALSEGLILRFIEFMDISFLWDERYYIPIEAVKRICRERFRLQGMEGYGPGPAEYYRVGHGGILGFIHTSESNCRRCSRLRITPTGELKLCLYEACGLSLRNVIREPMTDGAIKDIISARMGLKRHFNCRDRQVSQIYMSTVGG